MIELILTVLFIVVLAILTISLWSMAVRVEELADLIRSSETSILRSLSAAPPPYKVRYGPNTQEALRRADHRPLHTRDDL